MADESLPLISGSFWPSPWYIDLGGLVHFSANVEFQTEPPPDSFNYEIQFKDYLGNAVKTWTGTKETGGQMENIVQVEWDGIIDGEKIPYCPYRFYITVSYNPSVSLGICSGIMVTPGDSNDDNETRDAEPVDMFTGTHTMSERDLYIPDLGIPLVIERWANSCARYPDPGRYVFEEWMFNYQEYIRYDSSDNSYVVVFPTRQEKRFTKSESGEYTPVSSYNHLTLMDGPDGTRILVFLDGWKHWFDSSGSLIKVENRTGQCVNYLWLSGSTGPLLDKIISSTGRILQFSYEDIDDDRFYMVITDWIGREWKYLINVWKMESYTDPEGNTVSYVKDGSTFLGVQTVKYPDGTYFTNEPLGDSPLCTRVKKQYVYNDVEVDFDYDWEDRISTVTRGNRTWTYYFTEDGLKEKVVDPMGYEVRYGYDESRNLISTTDPDGNITTFTYDSKGNITSVTNPLGEKVQFQYGIFEQVTKIIYPDPFGYEETFTYDSNSGNILTRTSPGGKTTTYEYYDNGTLKKVTDSRGKTTEYNYNSHGNITSIKDGLGNETTSAYDQVGRLVKVTDPLGNVHKFKYDKNNNLIKETDPDGNSVEFESDCRGNVTKITDSKGRTATMEYDVGNHPLKITDPSGFVQEYTFDEHFELSSCSDSTGREWTFSRDKLGRLTRLTDPQGLYTTLSYPRLSEIVSTDKNGNKGYVYTDVLGRPVRLRYADESNIYSDYDTLGRQTCIRMTNICYGDIKYQNSKEYGDDKYGNFKYGGTKQYYGYHPLDRIEYSYDADGFMTNTKLKGLNFNENKNINMVYNSGGFLSKVSNIGGYWTEYSYDDADRLTQVKYRKKTFTFDYDNSDGLIEINYPNGIKKNFSYYDGGSLKQIKVGKGDLVLYQSDYKYDSTGKRIQKDIFTPEKGTDTYKYGYDLSGRLIQVTKNSQVIEEFEYDDADNRTLLETPNGSVRYRYDKSDRMSYAGGSTFVYNKNGNLTKKYDGDGNETRYYYDYGNRLKKIVFPDGSQSKYRYNAYGMRDLIQDRFGNYIRDYWWNFNFTGDHHIISSQIVKGNKTKTVHRVYGQGLLATDEDGTLTYFIVGDNDNVIALADDSGNMIARYEYSSFGEVLGSGSGSISGNNSLMSNPNRILFSGENFDMDSGLIYLRNRYYDPSVGRFITPDPLYPFGKNRYVYCNNNPIGWIDPSGLKQRNNIKNYLKKAREDKYTKKNFDITNPDEDACSLLPYYAYGTPNPNENLIHYGIKDAVTEELNKTFSAENTPLLWAYTQGDEGKLADLKGQPWRASLYVPVLHAYAKHINENEVRPGDLVFFKWSGYKEFVHVGVVHKVYYNTIMGNYIIKMTELTERDGNKWGIVKSTTVSSLFGKGEIEYGTIPGITDP